MSYIGLDPAASGGYTRPMRRALELVRDGVAVVLVALSWLSIAAVALVLVVGAVLAVLR